MAKIENKPSRWEVAEGSPMALIERAQLLISNPNKNERDELLHDCVLAGTSDALAAVQMLAEDMYDGDSFNVLMKWPAAWCLVAWEERGLRALIEITKRAPTSKNYSISFQVLATLSAEEDLPDSWLTSEIKTAIHARVKNWDGVYSGARVKLNALARSIESDYEAALYAAIPMPYLAATASSAIKPLFLAMSTRWLSLGDTTLTDYERLLKESGDDEPALHQFLEKHPQLLDPAALEVWSKPDLSGAKEPDFVIRRIDDTYLVVEVETPSKTLITRGCRCSAESTEAIRQALDYRSFLVARFAAASNVFPNFQTPDCLVVVGLERGLSGEQRAALGRENESRAHLRLAGFDWLAERARAVARNVVESRIDVRRVRMT